MKYEPGTRVVILEDCRDGAPAEGQQGTYEGDFPVSALVMDTDGEIDEVDLLYWRIELEKIAAETGHDWKEGELYGGRRWMYGSPNPRIRLDDGSMIWGYQCWWAPVEGLPDDATEQLEAHKAAMRDLLHAVAQGEGKRVD